MPFDKIFKFNFTTNTSGGGGSVPLPNNSSALGTINLAAYGTHPNGIILQLLDFGMIYTSSRYCFHIMAYGLGGTSWITGLETNIGSGGNVPIYWSAFAENSTNPWSYRCNDHDVKKAPGFSGESLSFAIIDDGANIPTVSQMEVVFKVRVIGY